MPNIPKNLLDISRIPDEAESWLGEAESSVEFLKENGMAERIVLFACLPSVLIHVVLVPRKNLDPIDDDDLLRAQVHLNDSWIIQHSYGGGHGHRVYLEPPLSSPGCKSLVGGEKLIFRRYVDGMPTPSEPTEISQKLVHSLHLQYVEERGAYCRVDDRGDIEEVIRVLSIPKSKGYDGGTVVTILRSDLDEYAVLSEMAIVVLFDFTRFRSGSFSGWNFDTRGSENTGEISYNSGRMNGHASFVNGYQIIWPVPSLDEIIERRKDESDPSNRQYATFKAQDWKNDALVEVSCSSEATANYFQKESQLPFDLSPVFFRAEVLHRFKADPEKYTLQDRSISCRGAWYLQTYDINAEGQVHTYLKYLSHLPYEEQIYWQAFNEWPKGPISKRAFTTDFKGDWSREYDPLVSIKKTVADLDSGQPNWWNVRGEELLDAVQYPATESVEEWANEIMALDQLLVEGLQTKAFRSSVEQSGRSAENEWGSLKLAEECFTASGLSANDASDQVGALKTLHKLRTLLKGHSAVRKKQDCKKQAIKDFGTLRNHFRSLSADCDETMTALAKMMELNSQ